MSHWQYDPPKRFPWETVLIIAILLLGLFAVMKVADDAIARQDLVCQEDCQ